MTDPDTGQRLPGDDSGVYFYETSRCVPARPFDEEAARARLTGLRDKVELLTEIADALEQAINDLAELKVAS